MPIFLCFSIRFLDPNPAFRGKSDGGGAEWPPSPLRLFQALVDSAASRWRLALFTEYAKPTLEWLEASKAPLIVAPDSVVGVPFRISVPNNDLDSSAGFWVRGQEPVKPHRPVDLRTMKAVRPVHLRGGDAVHFLFSLPESGCPYLNEMSAMARSITHLGWGIDMVAGDATVITDEDAAKLTGERWFPASDSTENALRVPKLGTLDDLLKKHAAFLSRLSGDGFKPVPPLRVFDVKGYRRAADPAARLHYAAFRILAADPDDPKAPAFDTARKARDVASWVRNAAGRVCAGEADVATFVHGHDTADAGKPAKGAGADARLLYLPLPTVTPLRVEAIRRVLVAGPIEHADRVRQVGRRLEGAELTSLDCVEGVLAPLAASDWVLQLYTRPAAVWSTVTPVVLPGYDDRDPRKVDGLIRKAFVQAGLSGEVVDQIRDLAWRNVGFRAGVDPASRYERPDKLTGRVCHVRVTFGHPVVGPLAVGAGRYRGFGVFVAETPIPRRSGH